MIIITYMNKKDWKEIFQDIISYLCITSFKDIFTLFYMFYLFLKFQHKAIVPLELAAWGHLGNSIQILSEVLTLNS